MKTGKYKFVLSAIAALVLCAALMGSAPDTAFAAGTTAGTTITNNVTVGFVMSGTPNSVSASSSFVVDRMVNVTVTNNSNPSVTPNQLSVPMSFRIINIGNASQRYELLVVSRVTDSFDMSNVRVFRDNNGDGSLDGGDTQYSDAGTFGDLVSDASFTVMIVADTPGTVVNGQTAVYDLVATSVDAGTLTVSVPTAGSNTAGVDTVFIDSAGSAGAGDTTRDGKHSAAGTFTAITTSGVTMNKTVLVLDPAGGNLPVRGATLRYTITVTVAIAGTAQSVVVSDLIPANTDYVPGSMRLTRGTTKVLTDIADADEGDMGVTTPSAVTVRLGDLTSASPVQTIVFDVRIQ